MIEWIPTAIVFALGSATLAIAFTASLAAYFMVLGFRKIREAAISAATDAAMVAAKNRLTLHLNSEEFKEMVRNEASTGTLNKLLSEMHNYLTSAGGEADHDGT